MENPRAHIKRAQILETIHKFRNVGQWQRVMPSDVKVDPVIDNAIQGPIADLRAMSLLVQPAQPGVVVVERVASGQDVKITNAHITGIGEFALMPLSHIDEGTVGLCNNKVIWGLEQSAVVNMPTCIAIKLR